MCHPRYAFKLYGDVNSVKKHNYKIWLNDCLGILYKNLLAENCQNLKMAAISRNMLIQIANKHYNLAIFYSCVLDWIHLTNDYFLNKINYYHVFCLSNWMHN